MIWRSMSMSISRATKMPALSLLLLLIALFAGVKGKNRNPCFDACVSGVLDLDLSACNIGAAAQDVEDLKICLDTVKEDLVSLDLSDNALSFLPVDVFPGLSKVVHLRLQDNQLTTLPAGLFGPLSSLELLNMERNSHLQCIPATTASTVLPTVFPGAPPSSSSLCQCTSGVAVSYNCGDDECVEGYEGYVCVPGHTSISTRTSALTGSPMASRRQLLPEGSIYAAEACADFAMDENAGSSWALGDCMNVWENFSLSLPPWMHRRFPLMDVWKDTASDLRQANKPCLVAPTAPLDGVGSCTIRHLASWIFSKQMGCDWVTPDWGKKPATQGNGTVVYCHRAATTEEMENSKSREEQQAMRRCSIVNWLSYFQFDVPSVALPEDEKLKFVEPGTYSADSILAVQNELLATGLSNRPWDRVVFRFHPSYASTMLLNLGSWDVPKRQLVRRVLQEARENFHRHPREWYDESPKCAFSSDRLHFAVHVRMGDRREFLEENSDYFDLLERVMAVISTEVVAKGLTEPHFHIFSETLVPCPSEETGLFDEFPTWPLSKEEALECWAAPIPDDCPNKRNGFPCTPDRDGVFKVVGKNILLHVGADVQNDLSCMTQADGVLMGCSTFGQVAGILSKGISMFSLHCGGTSTPDQYKSIPPIAVAEMGRLWVPVAGSWRDPVLTSVSLFRRALDDLLSESGLSV